MDRTCMVLDSKDTKLTANSSHQTHSANSTVLLTRLLLKEALSVAWLLHRVDSSSKVAGWVQPSRE